MDNTIDKLTKMKRQIANKKRNKKMFIGAVIGEAIAVALNILKPILPPLDGTGTGLLLAPFINALAPAIGAILGYAIHDRNEDRYNTTNRSATIAFAEECRKDGVSKDGLRTILEEGYTKDHNLSQYLTTMFYDTEGEKRKDPRDLDTICFLAGYSK
ncbi:MAG: hypothetical protein ACTSXQ_00160 [Alphaproteobacteria bacterium]